MATETLGEKKAEEEPERGKEEDEEVEEKGDPEVEEKSEAGEEEVKEEEGRGEEDKEGKQSGKRTRKTPGKEKGKPLTPTSDRPARERKVVERYSVPDAIRPSSSKSLSIEKGSGTPLKDIPNVAFKLSKRKADEELQMLHNILFGKKGKLNMVKRNIGQFSGFVWVENEGKQKFKLREKLDKCNKDRLLNFCDLLNIPRNKAMIRKEELATKIVDFLESPHATTDVLLADKEQKGKKRKLSGGRNVSSGQGSATAAKGQKKTTKKGEKQKQLAEDQGDEDDADEDNENDEDVDEEKDEDEDEDKDDLESSDAKDGSEKEEDNDEVPKEESGTEEEEAEAMENVSTPKASSRKKENRSSQKKKKPVPSKKTTPAKTAKSPSKSSKKSSVSSSKRSASDADGPDFKKKGSAAKKQKVEKEITKDKGVSTKDKALRKVKLSEKSSGKDQGKGKSGKKAKVEPTREEMHAVVVDILKEVDFNTATLSDILRQLSKHFGIDLTHQKAEVKEIITEVINNMSDEEDGEEAKDNSDEEDDGEEAKDNADDDA